MNKSILEILPCEIWHKIFVNFVHDEASLLTLEHTSPIFKSFADEYRLWDHFAKKRKIDVIPGQTKNARELVIDQAKVYVHTFAPVAIDQILYKESPEKSDEFTSLDFIHMRTFIKSYLKENFSCLFIAEKKFSKIRGLFLKTLTIDQKDLLNMELYRDNFEYLDRMKLLTDLGHLPSWEINRPVPKEVKDHIAKAKIDVILKRYQHKIANDPNKNEILRTIHVIINKGFENRTFIIKMTQNRENNIKILNFFNYLCCYSSDFKSIQT